MVEGILCTGELGSGDKRQPIRTIPPKNKMHLPYPPTLGVEWMGKPSRPTTK